MKIELEGSMFYVKEGDRVEVKGGDWGTKEMGEDEWIDLPSVSIPSGTQGSVSWINVTGEFHVKWDNDVETIEMANAETEAALVKA